MAAEGKMQTYWREGRTTRKWRMAMYNAIVAAKLAYGLEVLTMNDTLHKKLDSFRYRGMRQIFNTKSTYIERSSDT